MSAKELSNTTCSGQSHPTEGSDRPGGPAPGSTTPHPPLPVSDPPAPTPRSYRGYFSKPFSKEGGAGGNGATGALIEAWMEFLHVQKGHVGAGIEKYAVSVQALLAWLEKSGKSCDPTTVSRAAVEEWQKHLFYNQGNVSNRTRAGKLAALRSFFGWLVYAGHRKDNPTAGIPSPKIVQGQPHPFSTEELSKIIAAPDVTKPRGIRDLALLMILYAVGPRISELCALDTTQVVDTGGHMRVRFVGVKGGKDRTLTLRRTASQAVRNWITVRRGLPAQNQALFVRLSMGIHTRIGKPAAQKLLKKYAGSVGLDCADVFAHRMRATAATDYYNSGSDNCAHCGHAVRRVDLLDVQLFLGHADPKTTLSYIAVSERQLKKLAIPDSRFHEITAAS